MASDNSQRIYKVLRERICLLYYPPGEALREETLAEEFGVSRTPIRRALHRLEFEGLVSISRGSGTIVTTIDLKQLKDIYALRLKLTELVGELSPSRISEDKIQKLETLLEESKQMHERPGDVREMGRIYNDFHSVMLNVIGNLALRRISDQLFHQTARVWLQILPDLNWQEEVDMVVDEIGSVIEALRDDDMKRVARIRYKHMAMLLQRVNDYLGSALVG